jgi:hypothetical protein
MPNLLSSWQAVWFVSVQVSSQRRAWDIIIAPQLAALELFVRVLRRDGRRYSAGGKAG